MLKSVVDAGVPVLVQTPILLTALVVIRTMRVGDVNSLTESDHP